MKITNYKLPASKRRGSPNEIGRQITKFRRIILDFPRQFPAGLKAAETLKMAGKFDGVVVCGMGGSAWPAELLQEWLKIPLPFYVNKTYDLPAQTTKNSLIIISSYSGNTEEPLNCYREAKKRGLKLVCLTTNGRLKELCQKEKTPLVLMPKDVPEPRLGCGYAFAGLAKILIGEGLIKDVSREILSLAASLNAKGQEKDGQALAEKINGKIPVVYAPNTLKTLAYIWKIKFNETAKIPSFYNYFPELNHNELSAYAKTGYNFFVLILRDAKADPRILKRMALTAELIMAKNIKVEFLDLAGKSLLEKIFNSVILADWVSYHLAMKNGLDPISVKLQEEFKRAMR